MEFKRIPNTLLRLLSIPLMIGIWWYTLWVFTVFNDKALYLSIPFCAATFLTSILVNITIVNNWNRSTLVKPTEMTYRHVCVLISTYMEDVESILRPTVESICNVEWPEGFIAIFVGDDGDLSHQCSVKNMLMELKSYYPYILFSHVIPPRKGDSKRQGSAKSGNLNAQFEVVKKCYPNIDVLLWLQDADDLAPQSFLLDTVPYFSDSSVGYVQTRKSYDLGNEFDVWGNQEYVFFSGIMPAKNDANAVICCGSGTILNLETVESIGGFPQKGPVEDFEFSFQALKKGWRGFYISDTTGAVGLVQPKDFPNIAKQRGTWCIDTVRLLCFNSYKGLNIRQRLHFIEILLFYFHSLAVLMYAFVPIFSLIFGIYPVVTTIQEYLIHAMPFLVTVLLYMCKLGGKLDFPKVWNAWSLWWGLSPIYAKASIQGLLYKWFPTTYKVTRKFAIPKWYWRETLIQMFIVVGTFASIGYHLLTHNILKSADLGTIIWALFMGIGFSRMVKNGWYGVQSTYLQRLSYLYRKFVETESQAITHVALPVERRLDNNEIQ